MWVEKIIKHSLYLRQCKVYQPARSQRKKGAKKKKNTTTIQCFTNVLLYHIDVSCHTNT